MHAVTYLAPRLFPLYDAIIGHLSARLRLPITLTTGSHNYREALDADLLFICGLPYVLRNRRNPPPLEALAAPVLQGERYGGKPIYFSDVIVHQDSPFRVFDDLRGASWAYNEPESQSGYGITRYELLRRGLRGDFFGRVVRAGYHQKAIEWVCQGKIDAAAIDSQVLALSPGLPVRVIEVFGASTIQPFAVASRLPAALKQDIQAILTSLHHDLRTQLETGGVAHFVAVGDANYNDIRAMLAACEAANFLKL